MLQNPPNYPENPKRGKRFRNVAGLVEYLTQLARISWSSALYKSTGGQPNKVGNFDRIVQLTAKALGQEARLKTLIKDLKPNQLNSLITMIQCGGIAHHNEIIEELVISYGGRDKDWEQALLMTWENLVCLLVPPQNMTTSFTLFQNPCCHCLNML